MYGSTNINILSMLAGAGGMVEAHNILVGKRKGTTTRNKIQQDAQ
jgi:hypothetical protein